MDGMTLNCPGCGKPVAVDPKTRQGECEYCGNYVTYPRRVFNQSSSVTNQWPGVLRSFEAKLYNEARAQASDVLAVAVDHAPALCVQAFYYGFVAEVKRADQMKRFFEQLEEIDLDPEEGDDLIKMFLMVAPKLWDYEDEILGWAVNHADNGQLLELVENFSPSLILRRTNIDFFTPQMAQIYKGIAARVTAPKTCYALMTAMVRNPDSPYPKNSFFLKTKTARFYQDFVLPLGEILNAMADQATKEKFMHAYKAKRAELEQKMGGK